MNTKCTEKICVHVLVCESIYNRVPKPSCYTRDLNQPKTLLQQRIYIGCYFGPGHKTHPWRPKYTNPSMSCYILQPHAGRSQPPLEGLFTLAVAAAGGWARPQSPDRQAATGSRVRQRPPPHRGRSGEAAAHGAIMGGWVRQPPIASCCQNPGEAASRHTAGGVCARQRPAGHRATATCGPSHCCQSPSEAAPCHTSIVGRRR